jgi:hypothetical protein
MNKCVSCFTQERTSRSREGSALRRNGPAARAKGVEQGCSRGTGCVVAEEGEEPIRAHFSKPEVQNIDSTTGCGCDFPYMLLNSGEWHWWDGLLEPGQVESEQINRDALVGLLRSRGGGSIELYGVWYGDFAKVPKAVERISLSAVLDSSFRFKERGFYHVDLTN